MTPRDSTSKTRGEVGDRTLTSDAVPQEGATVTIEIEGLGFGGEGYTAIAPGWFVSVPHTLPGERVRVRLGAWRRGRAFAEILAWETRSTERIDPACDAYDRCSGCALRHA